MGVRGGDQAAFLAIRWMAFAVVRDRDMLVTATLLIMMFQESVMSWGYFDAGEEVHGILRLEGPFWKFGSV